MKQSSKADSTHEQLTVPAQSLNHESLHTSSAGSASTIRHLTGMDEICSFFLCGGWEESCDVLEFHDGFGTVLCVMLSLVSEHPKKHHELTKTSPCVFLSQPTSCKQKRIQKQPKGRDVFEKKKENNKTKKTTDSPTPPMER